MVAITVILAAVIGTFVLGLGDNLQNTAPTASISFDQAAGNNNQIKVIHDGGASLDPGRISFSYDSPSGTSVSNGGTAVTNWPSGDKITAGDSTTVTLDSSYSDGEVLKVVWTSDGGGTSSVIGRHEVNV